MNKEIELFLESKRIAVLGASQTGKKMGNTIVDDLTKKGYEVFLVHPAAKAIDGRECHSNLTELKGQVDGAVFCIPPHKSMQAVKDAAKAGLSKLWLQQGSHSPEVLALANKLGLTVVAGKCIMMYAEPVKSIHKFHQTVNKIFGKY